MISIKKLHVLGLMLLGVLTLSSACTLTTVHHVGSHKVTVARHGFQKSLDLAKRDGVESLEYRGVSAAGTKTTVVISGDKVKVNGVDVGKLRAGDSVLIGDEGVAVNAMDYGESEKYLKGNASGADVTASK